MKEDTERETIAQRRARVFRELKTGLTERRAATQRKASRSELDKLFSGAAGQVTKQTPTKHKGSKWHRTTEQERSPRRIMAFRLFRQRKSQQLSARNERVIQPMGVAERLANYRGQTTRTARWDRLTPKQRRRVEHKLNHAQAKHQRGQGGHKRPSLEDLDLHAAIVMETAHARPLIGSEIHRKLEPTMRETSRGALKAKARARGGRRGA
jgi:hypothetical protein